MIPGRKKVKKFTQICQKQKQISATLPKHTVLIIYQIIRQKKNNCGKYLGQKQRKKKIDEGMIMTKEEEEIKRRNKEQKERKKPERVSRK